ncbi:hypothetical protein PV341_07865 [Streptomyces sp. PA03-1a]|nr:hypothetical protein [Streptomyces sp. PA03-1a]MDX2813433.1 hypothetical protein [Streptomyces sp. PA03-5A]
MTDTQPPPVERYYRNPEGGLTRVGNLDDDQVLLDHGYTELTADEYQAALDAAPLVSFVETPED